MLLRGGHVRGNSEKAKFAISNCAWEDSERRVLPQETACRKTAKKVNAAGGGCMGEGCKRAGCREGQGLP